MGGTTVILSAPLVRAVQLPPVQHGGAAERHRHHLHRRRGPRHHVLRRGVRGRPETDDLEDPAVWKRCNPSLGEYPGFATENFAGDFASAKANTGEWLNFQRYRLNIFRRPEDGGWIDLVRWDACRLEIPDAERLAYPCWLWFDDSQTTDPSSVAAVWPLPGRKYHAKSWARVAAEGVRLREQTDLPRYQQFEADGHMTITEGNVIDKQAIREHIRGMRKAAVMDGSGYTVFGTELETDGFEVFRMPQTIDYFADPTREFAEAVLTGAMSHEGTAGCDGA
ncbi:hypothetical protein J0H58_37380 [bacterium]|nr:hypothetical protein [bacterium]